MQGNTILFSFFLIKKCTQHIRGHEMAQLVEALRYKSEGRGFDCNGVTEIFH
jgi:hypothetical protein